MDSTINPIHLVTPDRTVVPMPKPFDAPPGQVPFHRMLESENRADNMAENRAGHLANRITQDAPTQINRPCDCYEPSNTSPSTAPKLGEVLPVSTPSAEIAPSRSSALPVGPQAVSPVGRMIDITI
tara:strand:- start:47 stop:424 length:378 start_codon:yes stop_codon:yes gene_type:complete